MVLGNPCGGLTFNVTRALRLNGASHGLFAIGGCCSQSSTLCSIDRRLADSTLLLQKELALFWITMDNLHSLENPVVVHVPANLSRSSVTQDERLAGKLTTAMLKS